MVSETLRGHDEVRQSHSLFDWLLSYSFRLDYCYRRGLMGFYGFIALFPHHFLPAAPLRLYRDRFLRFFRRRSHNAYKRGPLWRFFVVFLLLFFSPSPHFIFCFFRSISLF